MTQSTDNIQEAAKRISEGESIVYRITPQNGYQLFCFAYWQWHYRTLKAFRTISYERPKDALYYLLKLASVLSFGYYTIHLKRHKENEC
jgi:hypothetical protein